MENTTIMLAVPLKHYPCPTNLIGWIRNLSSTSTLPMTEAGYYHPTPLVSTSNPLYSFDSDI